MWSSATCRSVRAHTGDQSAVSVSDLLLLVFLALQVNPAKYKNIPTGFSLIVGEQGAKGLFKGWAPTAVGYSAQGACKFGFYEFFKKCVRVLLAYAVPPPGVCVR